MKYRSNSYQDLVREKDNHLVMKQGYPMVDAVRKYIYTALYKKRHNQLDVKALCEQLDAPFAKGGSLYG